MMETADEIQFDLNFCLRAPLARDQVAAHQFGNLAAQGLSSVPTTNLFGAARVRWMRRSNSKCRHLFSGTLVSR